MSAADARPATSPEGPTTLRERNYILVLANQFLSYVSNQTIIPVIPLYLAAQGHGESFIGLVIAAFNVTSFSARPVFGSWVDRGHPRAALSVSCVLLSIASWAYLIPNMLMLFIVRGIHGLGWAGVNTVGSAWVAHLAPRIAARRQSAISRLPSPVASPSRRYWASGCSTPTGHLPYSPWRDLWRLHR